MRKIIQLLIQTLFLFLFILLAVNNKVQLWMGIFVIGIAASFVFNRIYCGWFCQINSLLKFVTWTKRKLHIKSIPIPRSLEKPWIRIFVMGLFLLAFLFTLITGKRLPVLHILIVLGVFLTFLFPEELWHAFLCPYGTILSLSASKAKYGMTIDSEKCNNCSACKRVCPSRAIEKKEKHYILNKECLVCMKCEESCRQHAIKYK